MPEIFWDVEQGSENWARLRCGVVTASELKSVIAKGEGKMRRKYMLRLAGERLLGQPLDTYENGHMLRGRDMEAEARRLYVFHNEVEIIQVGFIRNGDVGYSPDGLIGDDGGIEIKTMLPDILIDTLLRGRMPPEHFPQIQGGLWVSEREWLDFVAFCPGLPLFVCRQYRDDSYIKDAKAEVGRFNEELAAIVERVRALGTPAPSLTEQLQQSLIALGEPA